MRYYTENVFAGCLNEWTDNRTRIAEVRSNAVVQPCRELFTIYYRFGITLPCNTASHFVTFLGGNAVCVNQCWWGERWDEVWDGVMWTRAGDEK